MRFNRALLVLAMALCFPLLAGFGPVQSERDSDPDNGPKPPVDTCCDPLCYSTCHDSEGPPPPRDEPELPPPTA